MLSLRLCISKPFRPPTATAWKGNAIWRAVPRLLWAILMLKAFMYLPPVYHMAKALSYIDIAWLGVAVVHTPVLAGLPGCPVYDAFHWCHIALGLFCGFCKG